MVSRRDAWPQRNSPRRRSKRLHIALRGLRVDVGGRALHRLATGCASTTTIYSVPPEAKVYLDGALVGTRTTPYVHSDSKVAGTEKTVVLKKEGYKDMTGTIRKEEIRVGPLIGAVLVLFPAIWILGYPEKYTFEMERR